jgi:hypothetical protein
VSSPNQPTDFTRLGTRDGIARIALGLHGHDIPTKQYFHETGAPKTVVVALDLTLGSIQYTTTVTRRMSPTWGFIPLQHWQDSDDRATECITVQTLRSVRTYRHRYNWSQKAAGLVHRNLQSLGVYLHDPAYQAGLLAQWQVTQAQQTLEAAGARFRALQEEVDAAVAILQAGTADGVYGAQEASETILDLLPVIQ